VCLYSTSYNLLIKIKSELRKIWKNRPLLKQTRFFLSFRGSFWKRNWRPRRTYFYALWTSKFFNFARKKQITSELYQENAVSEFLEALESDPHISDWQIRQAGDAIRLYFFRYRGLKPVHLRAVKAGDSAPSLLKETTRLLRMKHYSYSTERTYLHWIKRFLDYGTQTREKGTVAAFEVDDFKNFISFCIVARGLLHPSDEHQRSGRPRQRGTSC
jgi:hypothetical protein